MLINGTALSEVEVATKPLIITVPYQEVTATWLMERTAQSVAVVRIGQTQPLELSEEDRAIRPMVSLPR